MHLSSLLNTTEVTTDIAHEWSTLTTKQVQTKWREEEVLTLRCCSSVGLYSHSRFMQSRATERELVVASVGGCQTESHSRSKTTDRFSIRIFQDSKVLYWRVPVTLAIGRNDNSATGRAQLALVLALWQSMADTVLHYELYQESAAHAVTLARTLKSLHHYFS